MTDDPRFNGLETAVRNFAGEATASLLAVAVQWDAATHAFASDRTQRAHLEAVRDTVLRTCADRFEQPLDIGRRIRDLCGKEVVPSKETAALLGRTLDAAIAIHQSAARALERAVEAWVSAAVADLDSPGGPAAVEDPAGFSTPSVASDDVVPFDVWHHEVLNELRTAAAQIAETELPEPPAGFAVSWEEAPDESGGALPWDAALEAADGYLQQSAARLRGHEALLNLRMAAYTCTAQTLEAAWKAGGSHVVDAITRVRKVVTNALSTTGTIDVPPRQAREALISARSEMVAELDQSLTGMARAVARMDPEALRGTKPWDELVATFDAMPTQLVMHSIQEGKASAKITVDLQEDVRDIFQPPWPRLLEGAAGDVRTLLLHVDDGLDRVLEVVDFVLADAAGAIPEDGYEEALSSAADGLRRASDLIDEAENMLAEGWRAYAETVVRVMQDDLRDLDRVMTAEGALEDHIEGARTRFLRDLESAGLRIKSLAGAIRETGARWASRAWRRVRRLVDRGRAAVGAGDVEHKQPAETLAPLLQLDDTCSALPRVYQRLFSLEPLLESTLLAGRGRDLVTLKQHVDRWVSGAPVRPLVVVGMPGSGVTSILRVARDKVLAGHQCHVVELDERCLTPEALEAKLPPAGDPGQPVAYVIDGAEHLICATHDTGSRGEAVLRWMSSRAQTLWILAMSPGAWHYLERAYPSAARRASLMRVASPDRDAMETIIMERHRRSGLLAAFEVPDSPSPLLKRKLKKTKNAEEHDAVLRAAFFDALNRASYGSVRLAIAYWLNSVVYDRDADRMTVKVLKPLDLNWFDRLPLDALFVLRAIWTHGTLDETELAQVVRLPLATVNALLLDLREHHVIEPVGPTGQRFRIWRLLVGPLGALLRRRNLVSQTLS